MADDQAGPGPGAGSPHLRLMPQLLTNAKTPKGQARREWWVQQYLAMGPTRSVRKVLELAKTNPEGKKSPADRTLWTWSVEDRWTERAARYDQVTLAKAEQANVRDGAREVRRRLDARLATARSFRHLVQTALTTRDEKTGEERLRRFGEMEAETVRMVVLLHRAAEHTETLIDGLPTARTELTGDPDRPLVGLPSQTELDEMRLALGSVVASILGERQA